MKINNHTLAGVRLGKGAMESLLAPLELKPFVTNESRLEHGVRVLAVNPRYASRSLSLEFQITGHTRSEFETRRDALYAEFATGIVNLEVDSKVYHLIYTGKSPSYSKGICGCKVKVGFEEPNPSNRT